MKLKLIWNLFLASSVYLILLISSPKLQAEENLSKTRFIHEPTAIPIIFSADKDIVPPIKHKQKYKLTTMPANDPRTKEAMAQIAKAFAKYPTSLLKKTIYNIYILQTIYDENQELGGFITWRPGNVYTIYISASNGTIESIFHHEYSHVIWDKYKKLFDDKKYRSLNPPGYEYGNYTYTSQNVTVVQFDATTGAFSKDGKSVNLDEIINGNKENKSEDEISEHGSKYGFITWYSETYIYEDWADYMRYLFMGNRKFWEMYAKHEAVQRKADFLLAIYEKIDPMFTLGYFKDLAKEKQGNRTP